MCLLLFKTDGEEEVALVRDGSFAPYVGVAEGSDEYESYLNVGSLLYFRSLNFSKSFSFSVHLSLHNLSLHKSGLRVILDLRPILSSGVS